ncbi:MAG: hypothetical protein AAFV53_05700 [Myxococcota bacterium]
MADPDPLFTQWQANMAQWWQQALNLPQPPAQVRDRYELLVDATLQQMHLPSRTDLTRLARITDRLQALLSQQNNERYVLQEHIARLEKEVVQARIEAVESRLALRDQLQSIEQRLASVEAATESPDAAASASSE